MKIRNRMKLCLMISGGVLLLAVCLSVLGMGMNLGLDFAGGMSMQYDLGASATQSEVAAALGDAYNVTVQGAGKNEALIRLKSADAQEVQARQAEVTALLQAVYPQAQPMGEVSYVGPVAGAALVKNALTSVAIAAVLMLMYIGVRFDFNSGLAAVLGLMHDVLIMLAFMVLLRNAVELNSSFIAAMLTIVGYSINNTIVIFDRIRENARRMTGESREEVVNRSVSECLGRTINTTLTTLITITALYILGVPAIREFALPIIVGIVSGAYSSNMINGYIWAILEERKIRRRSA